MFHSAVELAEKIRLGEDAYLELKEVRFSGKKISAPARESLADELAAFANSPHGGVCVLGVEDQSRDILGIPEDALDVTEDYLRDICADNVTPPLAPVIERLRLAGATGELLPVIKITVLPSLFVHKSPGGYFYRIGSAKRQMQPDFLARLFQQRSQSRLIRFDETPVMLAVLDDLDERLWRRFAGRTQAGEARESLLVKLAMAAKDSEGTLRPTVAGVLLACPRPRDFLPNAYIQAVAYKGTSIAAGVGYQLDAKDLDGPLDAQIMDACQFVYKHMSVSASKTDGTGRRDLPQYDMTAVFEAVVNAVAHRDYSVYGSHIRLRLFSDRLELFSPGALPNSMTVESLPYRQAARNEAISSLLAKCQVTGVYADLTGRIAMMDKRGEGVPVIHERTLALSGRSPLFRLIDDAELHVTLYAASPV